MRKFFIIFVLLAILISLIAVAYLSMTRKVKKGTEETAAEFFSPLQEITDFPLMSYWVNSFNNEIFVIDDGGKIKKIEAKNQTLVADKELRDVGRPNPSAGGGKVLIGLTIFDALSNSWISLPAGAISADWHPTDNQKMAYLTNDGLYSLDLKTGKSSLVVKINNRELQLDWAYENEIYLYDKPSSAHQNSLWLVNLKNKTLEKLLADENNLIVLWSPAEWGIKVNESLVIDKTGALLVRLNDLTPGKIFYTFPDKCLTTNEGLYCAVPTNISKEEPYPLNNYLKKKIYTNDSFYFVSINKNNKKTQTKILLRADELNPIDAVNLQLAGDKLLFINRYDRKLYSLNLKNN